MENIGPLDVMHECAAVHGSCIRPARAAAQLGMFLEWCRREEGLLLIYLAALFLYLCVVQKSDEVL